MSLLGTLLGSAGGVFASHKLTAYRISELEKKVDRHNSIVERTVVLERDQKALWRKVDENAADIKVHISKTGGN